MTNSEDVKGFYDAAGKVLKRWNANHSGPMLLDLSRLYTAHTQAKDQRIADLEAKVKRLESDLDRKFQHYDAAERESSALREKLARCHEGYVARGRTIDAYEVDLTELCRSKAALESELSSSRAEVERLTKERDQLDQDKQSLRQEVAIRSRWCTEKDDRLIKAGLIRTALDANLEALRGRCERAEKALADILSMASTQVPYSIGRTIERVASEALSPGQPEGEKARCTCHLGSVCGEACDKGRCHGGCPQGDPFRGGSQ